MMIKPGTVKELSQVEVQPSKTQSGASLSRLTVLLHAVPVTPRSIKVSAEDTVVLLGSLCSLLESVPTKSIRLVVFNLEQQKEIYREDDFTLRDLGDVHQAIFGLQLGTVDIHQLSPTGPQDFLEHLIGRELTAKDQADEIVFMGPYSRLTAKPKLEVRKYGSPMPKLVYVQYQLPKRLPLSSPDDFAHMGRPIDRVRESRTNHDEGGNGIYVIPDRNEVDALSTPTFQSPRDSIDSVVGDLKGRIVIVRTPLEFAKAIRELVRK